jgi:hypothetical protein
MTQESFQAGVHYGDWKGSFAADDLEAIRLADVLKNWGLLQPGEFVAGLQVKLLPLGQGRNLEVTAILTQANGFESLKAALESGEPLKVRKASVTMESHEFMGSFKQLEICFSRKGVLDGREIQFKQ